ncbi:MAG: hypothetical protein H9W81_13555 [Enterococcus sp.]|nr:hypothetical protein [Enterococcus sp.]
MPERVSAWVKEMAEYRKDFESSAERRSSDGSPYYGERHRTEQFVRADIYANFIRLAFEAHDAGKSEVEIFDILRNHAKTELDILRGMMEQNSFDRISYIYYDMVLNRIDWYARS